MIIRFPFLADSRIIKFSFYADSIPKWEEIVPDDIALIIRAHDNVEVWPTIYAIPNSIGMVIKAEDNVEITNIATSLDLYESAMRLVCNHLDVNIATSILNDGDGNLSMVIKADETEPTILIDAARTALFKTWLRIAASNGIDFSQEVEPVLEECDTYIHAHNGVEVGPINQNLERLSALMKLADSQNPRIIDEIDPLRDGIIDLMKIEDLDYDEQLVDLHLEIGALEDDDGNIKLVIRAVDDLHVIRGTPVTIGTLDPQKIGELDGAVIPDFIYF